MALPAGEAHAAFADARVEASGQLADDVVELSEPDRLVDGVVVDVVAAPAERDIGAKRVVDEIDVLGYVADRPLPALTAVPASAPRRP